MSSTATGISPDSGRQHEPDLTVLVVEWLRAELDDPEITAADNFLDVGAHSLTFTKLNRYLAESRGVALDMRLTYDHTLEAAAKAAGPASPH